MRRSCPRWPPSGWLAGLSSRHYRVGLEPVGRTGSGTSKSAVSRRFVARTEKALEELLARDLSELKVCAIFGDGLEVADHTIVAAIGVDHEGNTRIRSRIDRLESLT